MRAPNIARIKLVRAGTALDHNNVAGAYKRAGLPSFRLYDLRHTFASALLASGEQNLAALLDANGPPNRGKLHQFSQHRKVKVRKW